MKANAFLTGDRARDQRNVDLLMGAVVELYGRGGLDDLMRSAVDRAIAVTGAQRGVLLLPDAQGVLGVRLARHQEGRDLGVDIRYSRTVTDKVWKSGQPHLTVDAEAREASVDLARSIKDMRLLSILAAPLQVKDRSTGVLYVDSTLKAKEFNEGDRAVFEALAGLVAVAIEQARLAAQEAERKRLSAEVDVARMIQASLLPRNLSAPKGFDLAAEGRACVETSGDYYDAIPLEGGDVALVMGDVSGHGLGAALFMASVRALVRTLLRSVADLELAFARLNAYLCRDMPSGSFMSLFVGVLDPKASTLTWVSAGHNPPLLWRRGKPVEELGRTGPVLGVVEGQQYTAAAPMKLVGGDALLLFTDGLIEARGPLPAGSEEGGEPYGEERLRDVMVRHAESAPGAEPVLSGVLQDFLAFVGVRPVEDDVTCLVLRVVS